MTVYIPFGDWSGDGHKQYDNLLVEINSMEDLLIAQQDIRHKYGQYFFGDFAEEYDNPYLAEECWQALIEEGMPVSILQKYDTDNNWPNDLPNLEAALQINSNPDVSLEFVEHAFVWLMNKFGANIIILPEIPQINNWTCPGFQTVGYGCFW